MTEVTEDHNSENETAPFLDYCLSNYKCPYPCPCPAYLCDGHCPCPVPPPGALPGLDEAEKTVAAPVAEPVAAPEPVPVPEEPVNPMELINSFENDMYVLFNNAHENHFDYFVVGVFIANHFPSAGWILLSYLFSIPSINLLKQPNLFKNFARQNLMYLSLLFGICGGSQFYAMYCLSNVFPSLLRN
jgi:hypothetical protein